MMSSSFVAEEAYEVQDSGTWKRHEGRVPLNEERPVRVKLHLSQRMENEAAWDNGRELQFTRQQRKRLNGDIEILFQKVGGVHVSDVFSPPRVTKLARQRGMKGGEAYDLLTGWNLSDHCLTQLTEKNFGKS